MEVILKKDVENLGYANDIVSVKPGYANNYLLPRGLATVATESAKKVLAENLKQRAHKDAKILADAQALDRGPCACYHRQGGGGAYLRLRDLRRPGRSDGRSECGSRPQEHFRRTRQTGGTV